MENLGKTWLFVVIDSKKNDVQLIFNLVLLEMEELKIQNEGGTTNSNSMESVCMCILPHNYEINVDR